MKKARITRRTRSSAQGSAAPRPPLYVADCMNTQRAWWAEDATEHFAHLVGLDPKAERAEALHDLLCDLGHYADRLGLEFQEEVRRAIDTWEAEKADPFENGRAG